MARKHLSTVLDSSSHSPETPRPHRGARAAAESQVPRRSRSDRPFNVSRTVRWSSGALMPGRFIAPAASPHAGVKPCEEGSLGVTLHG